MIVLWRANLEEFLSNNVLGGAAGLSTTGAPSNMTSRVLKPGDEPRCEHDRSFGCEQHVYRGAYKAYGYTAARSMR